MSQVLRPSLGTFVRILLLLCGLLLAACGGSDADAAVEPPSPGITAPGVVNLDDADLLIEDLRTDPEIRAELSSELADQLGLSTSDADCLADRINVEDLLAMSAVAPADNGDSGDNGDDGDNGNNGDNGGETAALERILEAFDACDVPRSVFDQ